MRKLVEVFVGEDGPTETVTLSYDQRVKSRLKVELDSGEPAGLFLPRGSILKHGDKIKDENGRVIVVKAAEEKVSTIYVKDSLSMARACYHLGNRHVALQITSHFIRYQHDHVLDKMVEGLGLIVTCEDAAFEPEAGAYHDSRHTHNAHSHDH